MKKVLKGLKPGDTVEIQYIEKGGKRIACLPQTHFYIHKIKEIAQLLEERNAHAIISEKGLELIAKEIA